MASATFESFIEEHKIEIPAIQRDYVQGRDSTIEEIDKRDAFVDKLINAITDENVEQCHLEFIYGAENETTRSFIPLDGQQRLTTLFLLHWVIWQKSTDEAKESFPLTSISGFSYETRLSSTSFCKNLVSQKLLPTKEKDLRTKIEKQPWFSVEWKYDPTINAMLSMIDCIDRKTDSFSAEDISTMLKKICNNGTNVITFEELNMTEYDLTDSLYIKMNARGKQLTKFENWKSEFIKYLEEELSDSDVEYKEKRPIQSSSYKDYFCYSIEHEWTDLFWSYLKDDYLKLDEKFQKEQYPVIDKMFMNLFDTLCMFRYYSTTKRETDFNKISAVDKRKLWQEQSFVDELIQTLDTLYRIDHGTFFNELFYISKEELPSSNKEHKVRLFRTQDTNMFKLCVNNGVEMELMDLLLFIALIKYCNKHHISEVDDSLKAYMRTVRNHFESDIQNLRSRTTVQLNLRQSEFGKYNEYIESTLSKTHCLPTDGDCIIEDCLFVKGNTSIFRKSIDGFGSQMVVNALSQFCNASDTERIRVLVACGYKGTYLSDCIGRQRYFFGAKDKWDVPFVSDASKLSDVFYKFTEKTKDGNTIDTIIRERKATCAKVFDFVYYLLEYDSFINANSESHHFAVKGNVEDVDWIALGSYSSNPGTAYHTDPFAAAVEKIVKQKNEKILLSLYKQYSGKCELSIIKDKISWEPLFSVISRADGWHITHGSDHITEKIKQAFGIISKDNIWVVPKSTEKDMIQTCSSLLLEIEKTLHHTTTD